MPRAIMIMRHARDRGQRRGRLGDAEGQHRQHRVEPAAQRRRDGDGDVEQSVEEDQPAGPAPHRALPTLGAEAVVREREGVPVGPRSQRQGRRPWSGLSRRRRDESLEESSAPQTLARVEAHLDRGGRLDLDDAEAFDDGEDRREAEVAVALDHHPPARARARRTSRGRGMPVRAARRRPRSRRRRRARRRAGRTRPRPRRRPGISARGSAVPTGVGLHPAREAAAHHEPAR